jgi:hypothetical protein
MNRLSRNLACLVLFTAFSVAASASAAQIDGILIDKMCSAKVLSGGQAAAKAHDRDCLLQEGCIKTGFGVYTADGKYLKFDDAGDTKALEAIKASKKKDDYTVRVTGDVEGDSIKVTNLKLL